jgi:hypothetical protein
MADLEDIERQRHELEELALRIAAEKDPERIVALAKQMQAGANELLRKGRSLEAAFAQPRGPGQTHVELTPGQRARVAEATGAAIDVLSLDDAQRWDPLMPQTSPATIERLAMASVAERTLREATRKQVEQIVAELRQIPDLPPETKAAIDAFEAQHTRGT